MKQEFTLVLDDVEYPVLIDGETIAVNGRLFAVEVTDDDTVLVDGIAYDVSLQDEAAIIGGERHTVQVSGLKVPTAASISAPGSAISPTTEAGSGAVVAIMPGQIIRVMVEVGQQVEEGEPVCVLEAMKMENELHARQTGTVQIIHVTPGDDVEKDQVLVEIE